MFKKAQAAMEFLMTYGWAILVVLVVIGALAYFGVLSPSTLLPEKCAFPVILNCIDHNVIDREVTVVLLNGGGRPLIIRAASATGEGLADAVAITGLGAEVDCNTEGADPFTPDDTYSCPDSTGSGNNGCTTTSGVLGAGDQMSIFIREGDVAEGSNCVVQPTSKDKNKYEVKVYYSFQNSQSIVHSITGEVFATAP